MTYQLSCQYCIDVFSVRPFKKVFLPACLLMVCLYILWVSINQPLKPPLIRRNLLNLNPIVLSPTQPMGHFMQSEHNAGNDIAGNDAKRDIRMTSSMKLEFKFKTLPEALANRSSENRVIILAFVDLGAYSMALNFYLTSLKQHHITNFLFVSSSMLLCERFHSMAIPCYMYINDTASEKQSIYMSRDFVHKMNIRTLMILDTLILGYDVLHTDVDMYFFANPLPRILDLCSQCDVAPLFDTGAYNAGFLYIRSTVASMNIYQRMKFMAEHIGMDDQKILAKAIKAEFDNSLNLVTLPVQEFANGHVYFEAGHRVFVGDNPCESCLVVHNNWLVSAEAKVYRFKEMHMWMFDENSYYSNADRKYLMYTNPLPFGYDQNSWQKEKEALINALAIGRVLNRTVILPKFHCNKGKGNCTLLKYTKLLYFDKYFGDNYRESTFLSHPLVPRRVKSSKSEVIMIQSDVTREYKFNQSEQVFQPIDSQFGANSQEINKWFGERKESLLQFHSLYEAFSNFTEPRDAEEFRSVCDHAFIRTRKRQF